MLLFGTHVVEWSDTVKVLFSDAQKKFFEILSIVQLPIAFFGSRLVPLINYAIGPNTIKVQESYSSWKITPIRYLMLRSYVLFCRCVRECLFLTMLQFLETLIFFITWLPNTKLTQDVQTRYMILVIHLISVIIAYHPMNELCLGWTAGNSSCCHQWSCWTTDFTHRSLWS